MATSNQSNRKSYFLSVTPVNYSLTEGTNIPPPPDSPRRSPSQLEPPTPGGGPLTSHPATPADSMKGVSTTDAPSTANTTRDRGDSFRTQTSPTSAAYSPNASKPKGVRKLLSLSNLRSSFSSSRTSLSLPRASNDNYSQPHLKRPPSPGAASSLAPSTIVSISGGPQQDQQSPQLRKRKSGSWFKRKSSLFLLNGDGGLDTVEEGRPDTRESKRLKESPAPLLPEISKLKGAGITGGDLGWDEGRFKRDIAA